MRILFISPHPGFGGASTANRTMAEIMSSLGHEVIYIDEYADETVKSCKFLYSDFPIHKNVFRGMRRTKQFFENNRFDIIFIGVPIIGFYYSNLFRKLKSRGVKICYIFHSLSLSKGLSGWIDEFLQSLALYNATDLLFVSKFTLTSWSKYRSVRKLAGRSYVVYNAIQHQAKFEKLPNKEYNVSFVGRLSEEKDPLLFCKVAKECAEQLLPYSFHIYGDGPLMDTLKGGYSDCATFHGFERDTGKIYSNTDMLLMTSQFENCPMAILESSAHGIPCVAPYVGGIPEIVKSEFNGLLYNQRSSSEIVRCLNMIKDSFSSYSKNAYSESQKYTYGVIAEDWRITLERITAD